MLKHQFASLTWLEDTHVDIPDPSSPSLKEKLGNLDLFFKINRLSQHFF